MAERAITAIALVTGSAGAAARQAEGGPEGGQFSWAATGTAALASFTP